MRTLRLTTGLYVYCGKVQNGIINTQRSCGHSAVEFPNLPSFLILSWAARVILAHSARVDQRSESKRVRHIKTFSVSDDAGALLNIHYFLTAPIANEEVRSNSVVPNVKKMDSGNDIKVVKVDFIWLAALQKFLFIPDLGFYFCLFFFPSSVVLPLFPFPFTPDSSASYGLSVGRPASLFVSIKLYTNLVWLAVCTVCLFAVSACK